MRISSLRSRGRGWSSALGITSSCALSGLPTGSVTGVQKPYKSIDLCCSRYGFARCVLLPLLQLLKNSFIKRWGHRRMRLRVDRSDRNAEPCIGHFERRHLSGCETRHHRRAHRLHQFGVEQLCTENRSCTDLVASISIVPRFSSELRRT